MEEKHSDEYYVGLICNGEFNSIPGMPIGELFENFFDNINYNVVKEKGTFVDFTGEATCDDEPCDIVIRFKILDNDEEFEIESILVNDDELNDEEVLDLLDDIAYVCGATFEDDEYNYCDSCTSGDCSNCSKKDLYDENEDQFEGYNFEEDDYNEDDEDNEDNNDES